MSDDSTRDEVDRLMRLEREHEVSPEESDENVRILIQAERPDLPDSLVVDLEDFRWSYDWVMLPGPDTIQ